MGTQVSFIASSQRSWTTARHHVEEIVVQLFLTDTAIDSRLVGIIIRRVRQHTNTLSYIGRTRFVEQSRERRFIITLFCHTFYLLSKNCRLLRFRYSANFSFSPAYSGRFLLCTLSTARHEQHKHRCIFSSSPSFFLCQTTKLLVTAGIWCRLTKRTITWLQKPSDETSMNKGHWQQLWFMLSTSVFPMWQLITSLFRDLLLSVVTFVVF